MARQFLRRLILAFGVTVWVTVLSSLGPSWLGLSRWGAIAQAPPPALRVATYNTYMNRDTAGQLLSDLSTPTHPQIQAVAEIIQRVAPDVLLLQEVDYDASGRSLQRLQDNYLSISQQGATPIDYPYRYLAPFNTGVLAPVPLSNEQPRTLIPGNRGYAENAFGFGMFPGQYGMALLSKYPIRTEQVRTFQRFLWKDMPNALLPSNPDTPESQDWYSAEQLAVFRLSSKSHWDVPIEVGDRQLHILASHPTPPVFDGPENRNGRRNHDEIRLWADYITPGAADYLYDDQGNRGGLPADASFVIMGDQNADPVDGDSVPGAIAQLLSHPRINTQLTPASEGGVEAGTDDDHQGPPNHDTSSFRNGNFRLDYALPSRDLELTNAGVFWPPSSGPLHRLVGSGNPVVSSDHRLVWVDVQF